MFRPQSFAAVLLLSSGVVACDDDSNTDPSVDGAADAVVETLDMTRADTALPDGASPVPDSALPDAAPEPDLGFVEGPVPAAGDYRVRLKLVDVGGIELPFRLTLEVNEETRRITSAVLRATGAGGAVSDPILTGENLRLDADGGFVIPEGAGTLPAAFSPTGSDVEVRFTLTVRLTEAGLCGDVAGEVVTLDIPIEASTFGAVPEASGQMPPASCDGDGPAVYDRIDTCPAIEPGLNEGFLSAGIARSFDLFVPEDAGADLPLIFLHHGFTSSAFNVLRATQMDTHVEALGFVLVVPHTRGEGVDWDFLSPDDSPDLTLFDDIIKCVSEQYPIDTDRLHVAGISAGALWTAYAGVFRGDVLASVAGLSTGLLPAYPEPEVTIPFLTGHGGDTDVAFDQDFKLLTESLNADLQAGGHFVTFCDHGDGHTWTPAFTPWVLQFLLDHPKGAQPYVDALPEQFPDFCRILD